MKKKILIIEDEIGIRENIKLLLEAENFHVITANNGEKGIQMIQLITPDLIICDIMMDGIDGYEVLKTTLANKCLPPIPFVFLTAKAEKKDFRKGMNLGADDYITKPYDAEDLLTALNTRLKKFDIFKVNRPNKNEDTYSQTEHVMFEIGLRNENVALNDIIFIQAERQYSQVFVSTGKKYIVKKSLAKWETLLPSQNFIRVHRATIINKRFIDKIIKENNLYKLSLKNTNQFHIISRRSVKKVKEICCQL